MSKQLYDPEVEQALIGSLLIEPDYLPQIETNFEPDYFNNEQLRTLYQTMIKMDSEGLELDPVTIGSYISQNEEISAVIDDPDICWGLITKVPTSVNIFSYAEQIKRWYLRRQLYRAGEQMAMAAFNSDSVDEALGTAHTVLDEISHSFSSGGGNFSRGIYQPDDLITAFYADVLAAIEHGGPVGIQTGIPSVDDVWVSMDPGAYVLIGARPGMGKTTLLLNILIRKLKEGRKTVFFSLEMAAKKLLQRIVSIETGIAALDIRRGNLTPAQQERIYEKLQEIRCWPLVIPKTWEVTPDYVHYVLSRESDAELFMVDYLQLMVGNTGQRYQNRETEISSISRGLKTIANNHGIPGLFASQLSREVERRRDKRPMLSDLRDSGSLEQDSDIVAFIYRDAYYNPTAMNQNVMEIITAKNRDGQANTTSNVHWRGETFTIGY